MGITFHPLAETDLPLLHRWLNDPSVVRWWEGDDVSWDAVVRDYGPAADQRTEHWIASLDDGPIGWIQCYAAIDYAEEDEFGSGWGRGGGPMRGGDRLLIGEPDVRGQGLGTVMIRSFVTDVVFGRHLEWSQACASPYAANIAFIRARQPLRTPSRQAWTSERSRT